MWKTSFQNEFSFAQIKDERRGGRGGTEHGGSGFGAEVRAGDGHGVFGARRHRESRLLWAIFRAVNTTRVRSCL